MDDEKVHFTIFKTPGYIGYFINKSYNFCTI